MYEDRTDVQESLRSNDMINDPTVSHAFYSFKERSFQV